MDKNDKYFYLEKLFPDTSEIISGEFKSIEQIKDVCIFVLDTNILLLPYKTSKNSLKAFENIYKKLKAKDKLRIPERVIREFGKNRGKNLAEVYKYLSQKENGLNRLQLDLEIPPILADEKEYKKLISLKKAYNINTKEIKENIQSLQKKVYDYNWNDPVSELYKKIITPNIVIPVSKKKDEIISDLEFRITHSIAPGFKDSKKSDKGIGDLIIWQTIKEIGKKENIDIIYVTDDSKNDWFYVEEKKTVYPRYELLYEFKKETNRTIHILDVTDFLILFDTDKETIDEVNEQKLEKSISSNGNWVRIPASEIKIGMEVCYQSKSVKEFNNTSGGIVSKVKPNERLEYIITLKSTRNNGPENIGSKNFNWWRKIEITTANTVYS